MPPKKKAPPPPPDIENEEEEDDLGDDPFAPLDEDDFDQDADDLGADIAAEAEDPNRVDLRGQDPGPIRPAGMGWGGGVQPIGTPQPGQGWHPGMGGQGGYLDDGNGYPMPGYQQQQQQQQYRPPPQPGRPTESRIWKSAHLHPEIPQLRVWKDLHGKPVLLGDIGAQASVEEFIQTFYEEMPKRGEGKAAFMVRPLDNGGNEVQEEIVLPAISENHVTLKRIRAMRSASDEGGRVRDLEEKVIGMLDDRLRHAETRVEEERRLMAERTASLAERETQLASRAAASVEGIMDRTLKAEHERAERLLEAERQRGKETTGVLNSTFAAIAEMQEKSAQREREANDTRLREELQRRQEERADNEERRNRDKTEWEQKLARERMEHEQRWEREKLDLQLKADAAKEEARLRDAKEQREWDRKRDEQRRDDERRATLEREDRERREKESDRMFQLRMKEMEQGAQRDREHAERMMQLSLAAKSTDSVEGIVERGAKLLGGLGINVKEPIPGILNRGDDDDIDVTEVLSKAIEAGASVITTHMQTRPQLPGAPGFPQLPGPMQPPQPNVPGGQMVLGTPADAPAPTQAQPATQQPGQPAPAPQAPAAPTSALPLQTQKVARNALRDLVKKLRAQPETAWQNTITLAVSMEPSIYHYIKEQSILTALREALGALRVPEDQQEAFAERILAHDAMTLIPDDVPRR